MSSYIGIIRNFWVSNAADPLKPSEVALYLYLVERCNRARWANPFAVPTAEILADLGMPYRSFRRYRSALVKRGLITVKRGCKDAPTVYTVNGPNWPIDKKQMGQIATANGPNLPIDTLYNNKTYKTPPISPVGGLEEYHQKFFGEEKRGDLVQVCAAIGVTPAQAERIAAEIENAWRLSEYVPKDYPTFAQRLITEIKRSVKNERLNHTINPHGSQSVSRLSGRLSSGNPSGGELGAPLEPL